MAEALHQQPPDTAPPALLRRQLPCGAVPSGTMGQCDHPSTAAPMLQRPLRDAPSPSQGTAATVTQCYHQGTKSPSRHGAVTAHRPWKVAESKPFPSPKASVQSADATPDSGAGSRETAALHVRNTWHLAWSPQAPAGGSAPVW